MSQPNIHLRTDPAVLGEFSVTPLGVEASISKYIAECKKVVERSGLKHEMHAMGTNIEGSWNDVTNVIRQCHEAVHAMGVPRIQTLMKISTRSDKANKLDDMLKSVDKHLKQH